VNRLSYGAGMTFPIAFVCVENVPIIDQNSLARESPSEVEGSVLAAVAASDVQNRIWRVDAT